jgi:hypothetical protein
VPQRFGGGEPEGHDGESQTDEHAEQRKDPPRRTHNNGPHIILHLGDSASGAVAALERVDGPVGSQDTALNAAADFGYAAVLS